MKKSFSFERRYSATVTKMHLPLLSSSEVCATTSATPSVVFASSPASFHFSVNEAIMCVGVKKGAKALTRILYFAAVACDPRIRPTTPCLEVT